MNNPRRKRLNEIMSTLEDLKSQLETCMSDLEECRDEEQEYFDNIPENLQSSERYDRAETAAEALTEACDNLYTLIDSMDSITSSIEEAIDV